MTLRNDTQDKKVFKNIDSVEPGSQDQQIAELEKALEREKDSRREERFFFIFLTTIIFDIVIFSVFPNWAGPFSILILQIIFLILLAKRLGMEEVQQLLSRILGRVADGIMSSGDK